MDPNATIEEKESLRSSLELVRSVSDKHIDLLRPSARYYSAFKGADAADREKGTYTLIRDMEDLQVGIFDKPLPCFGCGVGWFSFLLGFVFPLMWYYAAFLYFGNHYRKDPREQAGLAAAAVAAMACSIVLLAQLLIIFYFSLGTLLPGALLATLSKQYTFSWKKLHMQMQCRYEFSASRTLGKYEYFSFTVGDTFAYKTQINLRFFPPLLGIHKDPQVLQKIVC